MERGAVSKGTSKNKSEVKRRHKFTVDEDQKLESIVKSMTPPYNWKLVSQMMKTRTPRQCRERYNSYLNYCLHDEEWTKEEDDTLCTNVALYGHKWGLISQYLPRHLKVCIKNRWKLLGSYYGEKYQKPKSEPKREAEEKQDDAANEQLEKMLNSILEKGIIFDDYEFMFQKN